MNRKLWLFFLCIGFALQLSLPMLAGGKEAESAKIGFEFTFNNVNSQQPEIRMAQSSAQSGEFAQQSAQQTHVPVDNHAHHEANQNQSQAQQQAAPAASSMPTTPTWRTGLVDLLKTPWKHPFLTAGITYTGLVASLVYAHRTFRSTNAWSRWKREMPLEDLRSMPLEMLSSELVREIQLRYLNPSAPLDNLWPLAQFVRAITAEERLLSWYIGIGSVATRLWLGPLFWTCSSRIRQARMQRERLRFLRKTFHAWAAQHRQPFPSHQQ